MRWIFDIAWLALLVFMGATWRLMPEVVGAGHKALPRDQHMLLMMGVALWCPWLATRGALWLARAYPAGLNLPNKDFWLMPERREATLAWLREQCFLLGLGVLLVFATLHYTSLQPAQPGWPALPAALLMAGGAALVLGFAAWVIRLHRRFAFLPAADGASEPDQRLRVSGSRSDELVWRELQPLWALLLMVPGVAVLLAVMAVTGPVPRAGVLSAAVPLLCVLGALLLVFGRLVIEVRGDALVWRFGWLGWPRWRVPLSDIVAAEPARSSVLEGWGIRFTREGMLYNAHGRQAVRLTLRSGRRLRLGTREPQRLLQALTPRIASALPPAR